MSKANFFGKLKAVGKGIMTKALGIAKKKKSKKDPVPVNIGLAIKAKKKRKKQLEDVDKQLSK
jgi:hypothetical protein